MIGVFAAALILLIVVAASVQASRMRPATPATGTTGTATAGGTVTGSTQARARIRSAASSVPSAGTSGSAVPCRCSRLRCSPRDRADRLPLLHEPGPEPDPGLARPRSWQPRLRQAYLERRIQVGDSLTRIKIPAIDVDVVVVEGTSASALRAGAGHYPSTPLPCEQGNVGIAGHRTTYGRPFNNLDLLAPGDLIVLETPIGICTYKVSEPYRIVAPDDMSVVGNVTAVAPHAHDVSPQGVGRAAARGSRHARQQRAVLGMRRAAGLAALAIGLCVAAAAPAAAQLEPVQRWSGTWDQVSGFESTTDTVTLSGEITYNRTPTSDDPAPPPSIDSIELSVEALDDVAGCTVPDPDADLADRGRRAEPGAARPEPRPPAEPDREVHVVRHRARLQRPLPGHDHGEGRITEPGRPRVRDDAPVRDRSRAAVGERPRRAAEQRPHDRPRLEPRLQDGLGDAAGLPGLPHRAVG